jgi:hypothetical protein
VSRTATTYKRHAPNPLEHASHASSVCGRVIAALYRQSRGLKAARPRFHLQISPDPYSSTLLCYVHLLTSNIYLPSVNDHRRRVSPQIPQLSEHPEELPVVAVGEAVRLLDRIGLALIGRFPLTPQVLLQPVMKLRCALMPD